MDPSSAWESIKAALHLNGWRAAAIALAGAAVFVLKDRGLLPFEIAGWALSIVGLAVIFCAAIAVVELLRAILNGFITVWKWAYDRWLGRRYRRQVLRHLNTLNQKEKEIFGYLLARNERGFDGAVDGGHAQSLIAKGLVSMPNQVGNAVHVAFVIPEFVWQELVRRRDEFPDTYQGQAHPWRRHWAG